MFSIIIPTYNEKKNIVPIFHNLKKINYNFEVIFVDDASNDGTDKAIKDLIRKNKKKNINFLLRNNIERDLSRSVMDGVAIAKFKYILVMDADLQHDFNNVNLLFNNIINSDFDIIVGSRFIKKKN
jgi:dolichol-phosphate mannosyltransferase